MKTSIAFIHTSPVALPPLAEYYRREAPEFEVTNLLDDGVLRHFTANDESSIIRSLGRMISAAREEYQARLALVTCSALRRPTRLAIEQAAGIPVLKIDEPMADQAVRVGRRIGVAVTFEPTVEPTRELLLQAANGRELELDIRVMPEAYTALRSGDSAAHDRILLDGIHGLATAGVDCIVLAQVSMARILTPAQARWTLPVFSSLETSLAAVRATLGGAQ